MQEIQLELLLENRVKLKLNKFLKIPSENSYFCKEFGIHTPLSSSSTVCAPLKAAACIFLTPFFTTIYIVDRLVLQTIYLVKKEILQYLGQNSRFIIKSVSKSRAGYNGACTVCRELHVLRGAGKKNIFR